MTDFDPTNPRPLERSLPVPVTANVSSEPATSPYEPTLDGAPATPVQVPESPLRRRPVRWPVAIVLIGIVLAVAAFVGILVTGRAPNAKVLAYVPDGTIAYGEARLDLPGDQRLALASFLSKFPGFADQSAIETKLNEVMDRFVGGVTNGDQAYTTDIEPWFDGELAFALGPLPDPGTLSGGGTAAMDTVRYLVLVSIKDETGVTAWFKGVATSSGVTMTDQAYDGANLTMLTGDNGVNGAYAVLDGKVAVLGDVDSVKAAVDTKGNSPFASQPNPKAALDATDSSHLGFMYLDMAALFDWSSRAAQAGGSSVAPGLDFSSGVLRDVLPHWAGVALRVEGDAVVFEASADRPDSAVGPTDNRASSLTDHVPAGALVVGIGHDVGATLTATLDLYRSEPSMKSLTDGIDQAVGFLGGVNGAIGWIGDAGYVVNQADGGIEAGLVIAPTDRAAADRIFTSLRTLLAVGGSQSGIAVRDESYAGATITTIDLGDVASLLAQAGIQPEQLGPGVTLPTGRVELAYAVTDQVVAIGSGPAFVKHILDTTASTSVASTDRYKALAGRVGNGTGVTYVDVAAIRASIESAMASLDPTAAARYDQELKPFLAPFDALIGINSVKDHVAGSKFIITVK
ncbi:MAG: DUF3352 domain-containing protein [Candidatus Limnocylindrales bacterium]